MKRSLVLVVAMMVVCLSSTMTFAKRGAPPKVSAIRHGGLEFRVRNDTGLGRMPGIVEAWDPSTNQQIWFRQIYVIRRDPNLESDVQDVFISGVKFLEDRNALQITNEVDGIFELNLQTLEVKTIKGTMVIQ